MDGIAEQTGSHVCLTCGQPTLQFSSQVLVRYAIVDASANKSSV
jgi:hypothetical protein